MFKWKNKKDKTETCLFLIILPLLIPDGGLKKGEGKGTAKTQGLGWGGGVYAGIVDRAVQGLWCVERT